MTSISSFAELGQCLGVPVSEAAVEQQSPPVQLATLRHEVAQIESLHEESSNAHASMISGSSDDKPHDPRIPILREKLYEGGEIVSLKLPAGLRVYYSDFVGRAYIALGKRISNKKGVGFYVYGGDRAELLKLSGKRVNARITEVTKRLMSNGRASLYVNFEIVAEERTHRFEVEPMSVPRTVSFEVAVPNSAFGIRIFPA